MNYKTLTTSQCTLPTGIRPRLRLELHYSKTLIKPTKHKFYEYRDYWQCFRLLSSKKTAFDSNYQKWKSRPKLEIQDGCFGC